ncbi:juvenile hormone acid O-methyltransferase-like [Ptychodera flava]|uniref:juvenile hormone acid O-methyltransferase-like n=1 Tax=Ptychodera flava TaxID=63121 RepID=UPI00396A56AB
MNPERSAVDKYATIRAADAVGNMKDITGMMTFETGDNVLDVGCGTGALTKLLADNVHSVTGLDKMPEMIDEAVQYQSADNITYLAADACDLTTIDKYQNTFDRVVANFVLHWVANTEDMLKAIHRYLKPGGQCYMNMCFAGFEKDAVAAIAAHTKEPKWAIYMEGYEYPYYPYQGSLEDFEENLRKTGFRNIQCRSEVKEFFFDNRDGAKASYVSFMDQASRIPKELREEYLEDVFNFAAEKGRTKEREYAFCFKLVSAVGCK